VSEEMSEPRVTSIGEMNRELMELRIAVRRYAEDLDVVRAQRDDARRQLSVAKSCCVSWRDKCVELEGRLRQAYQDRAQPIEMNSKQAAKLRDREHLAEGAARELDKLVLAELRGARQHVQDAIRLMGGGQ
jgi:hypothetical protein